MNEIVAFNYASLSAKERKATEAHAKEIRGLLERTGAAVVEIGRRLIAVRDALGPTRFSAWIAAEFRWSQPVASNYMQAARRFGGVDCLDKFQPSALVELSRARIPEAAVEKAVEKARAGELVTRTEAVQIAKEFHAGPAPRPVVSAARRQPGTSPDRSGDGFASPAGAAALSAPSPVSSVEAVERAVETLRESVAGLLPRLSPPQAAALADRLLDLAFRLRSVGADQRLDPAPRDRPRAVPAETTAKTTPTARGRKGR